MDLLREIDEEEEHYVTEAELLALMQRAGFKNVSKKRLLTQWGLEHLYVGWKR